jgi:hypothetical protein
MLIVDMPTAQHMAELVSDNGVDRPHAAHHGRANDDGVQVCGTYVSKAVLALASAASKDDVQHRILRIVRRACMYVAYTTAHVSNRLSQRRLSDLAYPLVI